MTWILESEHTKSGKPIWKVEQKEIYNEMKENAMKKALAYYDQIKKTGVVPKPKIISTEAIIICPE